MNNEEQKYAIEQLKMINNACRDYRAAILCTANFGSHVLEEARERLVMLTSEDFAATWERTKKWPLISTARRFAPELNLDYKVNDDFF